MPIFASMLAFITYSLTGHNLNPAVIFSSLALFNGLRLFLNILPIVIGQAVDAIASISRIEKFLLAEEEQESIEWDFENAWGIVMQHGAYTWEQSTAQKRVPPTTKGEVKIKAKRMDGVGEHSIQPIGSEIEDENHTILQGTKSPFELTDLNFEIARHELVAVVGTVGSGKSSLLAALAGQMRKKSGRMTMGATRAFCPQSPWIQNATIRENIVFDKQFDRRFYDQVVEACGLRADLNAFPHGDRTEIGERGITVSGGQKQRINIARAIYFDADIILMDDPLSAVDAHVGRHIMDQAICGLLRKKTRILATHQPWVLNRCDKIIWLEEGHIVAIDTFARLTHDHAGFRRVFANNSWEHEQAGSKHAPAVSDTLVLERQQSTQQATQLVQNEERGSGNVSMAVYKAYIEASGGLPVPLVILALNILAQGTNIVTSLWLSYWTEDRFHYSAEEYIGIYAAFGVGQAILTFVFSVVLSYYGSQASKVMFQQALGRVLYAPISFFDTTPLGRITNRFSKDIDTMDNSLTDAFRLLFITLGMIVSVFILIVVYYYYFVAALVPLACIFLLYVRFYRASAREIKRHEAVLRGVLFAKFSEAVTGTATIRAYQAQGYFSGVIRSSIDQMNSAYFLSFASQRWLTVRLDIIGSILIFIVGILVITSNFSATPSIGGLVLAYVLSIQQVLTFAVRQFAEVEDNMNATERIHSYATNLEKEDSADCHQVSNDWPQQGDIVFEQIQMRYRANLPLVLRGLSLHIRSGERIGIVGRTGAGKSSIISALLRICPLAGGSIRIDGVDTSAIPLHDVRSRITVIPQDPNLFRGTIRSNLDPFDEFTDTELWAVIRQAGLIDTDMRSEAKGSSSNHHRQLHLESPVEEEGMNFSLGQRQLLALARALIRNRQIIVCDEATSSVDTETDAQIQKTFNTAFRGKTLLCIAHRLHTILHYDRICVMDAGAIAELGTPIELYDRGGIFAGMCQRSHLQRQDLLKPK
jgi:ATP-binding cassette subfamily C (CFTR/MRP) protein 1